MNAEAALLLDDAAPPTVAALVERGDDERTVSPGWRMAERYLRLNTLPTAQKTAVVATLALLFHLVIPPVAALAFRAVPKLVDIAEFERLAAGWALALLAVALVSAATARSGREGRWTFYLFLFVYAAFEARLIEIFGAFRSPLMGVGPPLQVVLVGLVFDARAGWSAAACAGVLMVLLAAMEIAGTVPPPPGMIVVEGRAFLGWYLGIATLVIGMAGYVALLVQVVVTVRETQRRRLEAAHRHLASANAALERGASMLRRYVPAQLADQLFVERPMDPRQERRTVTVFFSDVEGFSAVTDRLEAEEIARLLSEYRSAMVHVAERYGGTVDKFIGDGMMVLFGVLGSAHDAADARRAVEMALSMQTQIAALGHRWHGEGIAVPFRVRMGINTGVATVGSFAAAGRLEYTAIGTQVNLAARIQQRCQAGRVLLSHATWALVQPAVPCTDVGEITVKGFHYPVRVYEACGVGGGTTVALRPAG